MTTSANSSRYRKASEIVFKVEIVFNGLDKLYVSLQLYSWAHRVEWPDIITYS